MFDTLRVKKRMSCRVFIIVEMHDMRHESLLLFDYYVQLIVLFIYFFFFRFSDFYFILPVSVLFMSCVHSGLSSFRET